MRRGFGLSMNNSIDEKILALQRIKWAEEKQAREIENKKYSSWLKANKGKYFKRVGEGFVAFYKIVSCGEYPSIAEVSIEDNELYLTDYDADVSKIYDKLVKVDFEEVLKDCLLLFEKSIRKNFKERGGR